MSANAGLDLSRIFLANLSASRVVCLVGRHVEGAIPRREPSRGMLGAQR